MRVIVGIGFATIGWGKLNNLEATTAFMASLSVPLPAFFAYLIGGLEFVGGIALIVGLYVRTFGSILLLIMIFAVLLAHRSELLVGGMKALLMGAGSFVIASHGAGNWRLFGDKSECLCPTKKK